MLKIIPIEAYFPSDVLPTARYLAAKCPGLDSQEIKFVGEYNFWQGVTKIEDLETILRISWVPRETSIIIENERAIERWILMEDYYSLDFYQKNLEMRCSILSPKIVKPEEDKIYSHGWLSGRLMFNEGGYHHWNAQTSTKKPSQFPLRRIGHIDRQKFDKRYLKGFETIDDITSALMVFKRAIDRAITLTSKTPAPPPPGSILGSELWRRKK